MKRLTMFPVVLAVMTAFFCFAQVTLAAPDLVVKVEGVQVNRNETKLVCEKTVSISVYDRNGETAKVLINNKNARSVAIAVYTWEASYSLKPGKNDIEVEALGTDGSTTSFPFSIMYLTLPVPGLSYSVSSLPASGKIEAFNKALVLSYPKNNLLVDGDGEPYKGADQNIEFKVVSLNTRPDEFHSSASPDLPVAFEISVPYGVYLLQPGQLTLTYNADISSVVADQLAIWYSPDNDWGDGDERILGGYTDARKHTVTAPFQFDGRRVGDRTVGYYAVFLAQREFQEFQGTDGSGVAWSYSCVMPMWAKGIAEANDQGPPTGTRNTDKTIAKGWFGLVNDNSTQKNITRLEFGTMMVKGLGLPLTRKPVYDGERTFSDVGINDKAGDEGYFGSGYSSAINYYDPSIIQYVETAARNGIIVGYPGEGNKPLFKPMNELTRQEAAVILARVANLKLLTDDEKVSKSLEQIFEDASSIPLWAASSVLAAQKAKLIVGKPGADPKGKKLKFDPQGKLSRAEAITLAYRLLKKLKKI